MVPAGFLTAQFLQKKNLICYAFVVMEELSWGFSVLLAWRKGKGETNPSFILPSYSSLCLSSAKAMQRSTTLFPPLKHRLHKSPFLQKLNCQEPYWDQARRVYFLYCSAFTHFLLLLIFFFFLQNSSFLSFNFCNQPTVDVTVGVTDR